MNYLRVALANPKIKLANPEENAKTIINIYKTACRQEAEIVVFPELALTGSTCGNLYTQKSLQDSVETSLKYILEHTNPHSIIILGCPLSISNMLYNCAIIIANGKIIGVVPKQKLSSKDKAFSVYESQIWPEDCKLNANLLIKHRGFIGVEIGEDLYSIPSNADKLALANADVIINISAFNDVVGMNDSLKVHLQAQSRRLNVAYLSVNSGFGESTTDGVYTGKSYVYECGQLVAENPSGEDFILADIDIEKIHADKQREKAPVKESRQIISIPVKTHSTNTIKNYSPTPFIPEDNLIKDRMMEILNLQAIGLAERMRFIGSEKLVLGLSGGLDSTWALIVCLNAMDILHKDYQDIVTISMPGFGTSERTKANAKQLADVCGTTFKEIDITTVANQHFKDIDHDPSNTNITFENAQARERTQILMDIAGDVHGFVVGTGDLSELALGWCTYNGDHMSMYSVNANVPKTLIRYMCKAYANKIGGKLSTILNSIIDTPISPELLPETNGQIQSTENSVGPYMLNDFFLYHIVHNGFSAKKILHIAEIAFENQYSEIEIKETLKNFYKRFFSQQFKRSCMPDGPKIGNVSLSPRDDWRMPSDAFSVQWTAF